ncbi:MAG: acylphosphatase [Bacteroidota bacterium]
MLKHFNIIVSGKVQGVHYRASTQNQALKLNLSGFVQNEPNGNVYIEAEDEEKQLKKLMEWCKTGPPNAIVDQVLSSEGEIKNFSDFIIKRLSW